MKAMLTGADILDDVYHSDHCPILLTIKGTSNN